MKKISIFVLALCVLAACTSEKSDKASDKYYFYTPESKMYYDASAEFDELSYAMGMNLGMGVVISQSDLNIDIPVLLDAIKELERKGAIDFEHLEQNANFMNEFSAQRVRPFKMAKQMQLIQPDANITIPEIYDEKFTLEKVSRATGYDMYYYLKRMMLPVNTYWLYRGIEDCCKVEKGVRDPEAINAVMMLSVDKTRSILQEYFLSVSSNVADLSSDWLKTIASKENVQMQVVSGDTLYYRVESVGSDVRPRSTRDSVTVEFDLYNFRGYPIESTSKRAAILRKQIATVEADTTLTDEQRVKRLENLNKTLSVTERPKLPLSSFFIEGVKGCITNIGEGGEITIWMPASLAYGNSPRSRMILPNEAVVINVKLHEVNYSNVLAPIPGTTNITRVPSSSDAKDVAGKAPQIQVKKLPSLQSVETKK